jgi:hypothetical protein
MYVVRYRNQKEKVSEEVVAILSTYDVETTINDFKKKKQNKSKWEVNRMYQDHWAIRFLWSNLVCGGDGRMRMVRCRVCSKINSRKKLSMPKLNSFIKHSSLKKCTNTTKIGVKEGQIYMCVCVCVCAMCCNLTSTQVRMSNDKF